MELLLGQISSLWVIPILTNIIIFIDSIVYSLAEYVYKLFELASAINLSKLPQTVQVLDALRNRVMALVTVFMLFRIALILINYLMNPEKLKDKNIGGTKVISNVVVVLLLLTLVYSGFLFGILGDLQTLIFTSKYQNETSYRILPPNLFPAQNQNIIANLVTGKDEPNVNYGRAISVSMLSSFLYLKEETVDSEGNTVYKPKAWDERKSLKEDGTYSCGATGNEGLLCKIAVMENASFFELVGLNSFDGSLEYYPFISTIAGIFLIFTFFKFVSEVLLRALKLFLLEIISPIAIVSYLDPEQKKPVFKNFWSTYFKIYGELFLRLALIYLAVIMINIVAQLLTPGTGDNIGSVFNESVQGLWFTLLLLKAFFIYAILKFIKLAPDLISDIIGVKLDNKNKGQFGKTLRGILGTGIGTAVGYSSARAAGLGVGAAALQGLSGGFQGGRAGARSNGLRDFLGSQSQVNAGIRSRSADIRNMGGLRNYAGSFLDQATGRTTRLQMAADVAENRAKSLEAFNSAFQNQFANSTDANGNRWGTRDDFVNNNEEVVRARMEEERLRKQFEKLDTSDPDRLNWAQNQVLQAREARTRAEANARRTYDSAYNRALGEAVKDPSRLNESSRAAYNSYTKLDPHGEYAINVESTDINGQTVYTSNVGELQTIFSEERASAQGQTRTRSSGNRNNR